MKKKYMKPAVETIVVKQSIAMLAGSEIIVVNEDATPLPPDVTW